MIKLLDIFRKCDLETIPGGRSYGDEEWANSVSILRTIQHRAQSYGRENIFRIDNLARNIKLPGNPTHLPCVRLPYPFIWMESVFDGINTAWVMTDNSEEDEDECFLGGAFITEDVGGSKGIAVQAMFATPVDSLGRATRPTLQVSPHKLQNEEVNHFMQAACMYPYVTLSLLHCKNVRAIEHRPNQKINRKRAKKGKKVLLSYKTLEVTALPIKPNPNTEETTVTDSKKRRHTVRGHFRDYTKGKGLFGKYKGIYWTGPMLRGHSEEGFIVKDYEVKL